MTRAIQGTEVRIPPVGLAANLALPSSQAALSCLLTAAEAAARVRGTVVAGVLQQGGFGTLLLDLGAVEWLDAGERGHSGRRRRGLERGP